MMIDVHARYRFRIEPTQAQRAMLARTFGCVRVVFNDVIRVRDAAWRAGEKLSRTDVQRLVITEAKRTEAREWLSEVASVPLVQSVQDAHKAYQNFFDSCTGKRTGRRVGKPRFKSRKDNRQSFRLTRNGFALRDNGRLSLAKIGEVRVRWSRDLPTEPSSVTIIREPDGHYYASFVVERNPQPLEPAEQETGLDLGISRLATCADTDGHRSDMPNPKHAERKQRKLARVQREKSRRQQGGANRDKSRHKEAVQHGKVARCRMDYQHKQALQLVRENQVVYVEDLNVAGMVRNRTLARAISDVGWGQFVRILKEKAEYYDRTVHTVNRWLPSSKACSDCGIVKESMPLRVRTFECHVCGLVLDRDYNAALNILAAGRAERINACGTRVSPPSSEGALGEEAGSGGNP